MFKIEALKGLGISGGISQHPGLILSTWHSRLPLLFQILSPLAGPIYWLLG
ncbi:MAG: hypothetical protein Sw2LagPseu_31310 [Shewanella algae]